MEEQFGNNVKVIYLILLMLYALLFENYDKKNQFILSDNTWQTKAHNTNWQFVAVVNNSGQEFWRNMARSNSRTLNFSLSWNFVLSAGAGNGWKFLFLRCSLEDPVTLWGTSLCQLRSSMMNCLQVIDGTELFSLHHTTKENLQKFEILFHLFFFKDKSHLFFHSEI